MVPAIKRLIKQMIHTCCWSIALFRRERKVLFPQRILLVAGGYLGDTFWAVQTIASLKQAYPGAEIHLAGRSFLHELAWELVPTGNIHTVSITSDRKREKVSWRKLFKQAEILRKELKPDLVFDLMCNRYSAFFCFCLHTFTVGMDIADEFSPLYSFCTKEEQLPSKHLAYRPRSIIRQFMGQTDSPEISLIPPVPQKKREELFSRYDIHGQDRLVMLIPGAGWAAKQWPREKFHDLASYLSQKGYKVVVSGSPNEKDLCGIVAEGVPGCIILCDSLADTISFLPHCTAVVGNDSGVVHLSAAFGIHTVSLFCQTNPDFCGALGKESVILYSKCPDRPSGNVHFCKHGTCRCSRPEWMDFSAEQVVEVLLEKLQAKEQSR